METCLAVNKIKPGKAPGVCGIYPEYIRHGRNDALHRIFTRVSEEEVVPEEWHHGIIISLYKRKGSKSDCCNYRGISALRARQGVYMSFSRE